MRANTLITFGASIACAGLAVFLAKGWIDSAVAEHQVTTRVPAPAQQTQYIPSPTTPVLVAEVPLSFGDVLDASVLNVVDYPEGSVPEGAWESVDALLSQGERVVALSNMVVGEPILASKISRPGERARLAQLITPGLRATTIRVSDRQQVAGFVLPGDRVDILFLRDEEGRSKYDADIRSDVILQNVRVLAVDQTLNDGVEGARPSTTVTLETDLDDAQRLALASDAGTLSLALRPIAEEEIIAARSLRRDHVVNPPRAKAPAKPRPRPTAPKPRDGDATAKVVVVRGDARDEVNVVSEVDLPAPTPAQLTTAQLAGGTL